jgi:phage terminase large subunit
MTIKKRVFNSVYYPYLKDYSHKYEVYYGGAGSGKSYFVAQKLIVKALMQKRVVLIIRKTLVSQRKSCWKLILKVLSDFHIKEYCDIRKSDMEIELPNGSIFYFLGLDDPEKIKSIVDIGDVWCEEATELLEEDFDQLVLRARAVVPNRQFFLSFNPISKANWCYKRWFVQQEPEAVIIKTTYKDNKFLDADYIKSLENMINTNPTYYRIYALGEFCTLDRLVYNNWKIQQFDYQEIKGSLLVGLDFGFSVDTTAIVASILQEDKLYVFREYGDTGLTNDKIANVIKTLGFNKSVIVADSAEPKSIEEIRKQGISKIIPSVKGPDSIIHGVNQLQQLQIIVHPSCVNTITEFENYTWQKKDGEYINKPVDQFNHYLDALRYSLQCVGKRLQTMNKSALSI